MRAVQRRLVETLGIDHFNSNDHDTTLVNVAAGRGVCLAPDFLDDHTGAFAWTPFDCPETVDIVLCTRREERRPAVVELVEMLLAGQSASDRSASSPAR
ncbi:hypothetical protein ACTQ49_06300 [Luteococcus sp. Sow4_B9]|uniref:hypothetical protein n=1 Tax=Luteococcus sp. Sow4_B9 TaxID=3438792 RepID=UPI003F9E63D8